MEQGFRMGHSGGIDADGRNQKYIGDPRETGRILGRRRNGFIQVGLLDRDGYVWLHRFGRGIVALMVRSRW